MLLLVLLFTKVDSDQCPAITYPRTISAGFKVQVTFHRSRVQIIAPSINYQTTQIPLDLIGHFVKRLGLGDSLNAVHLSLSR